MKRDWGPLLVLIFLTAFLAGLAWLTRHPEAEILKEAQFWPVVGPAAQKFRDAYLPPSPVAGRRSETGTSVEFIEIYGAEDSADWETVQLPPLRFLWVVPDTPLRASPQADSEILGRFEKLEKARLLEERPPWYLVSREGVDGWIRLENAPESDEPTFGREPSPVKALGRTQADPETLREALAIFGEYREESLGPHRLFTDSESEKLVERLGSVAESLAESYRLRYGLLPEQIGDAQVVLYRRRQDYRRLQAASPRLAGRSIAGHARGDVVTLYHGGDPHERVTSTLVHELVHVLNRRAIGPALPPWLDEGLADDLAMCEIDEKGRLRIGTFGGGLRESADSREATGAKAALAQARRLVRTGRMPPLQSLLTADWSNFVDPSTVRVNYAASALWIRFLLDADDGARREAFLDWLRRVAEGESADSEGLREILGDSWERLDAKYRVWLRFQLASADAFNSDGRLDIR